MRRQFLFLASLVLLAVAFWVAAPDNGAESGADALRPRRSESSNPGSVLTSDEGVLDSPERAAREELVPRGSRDKFATALPLATSRELSVTLVDRSGAHFSDGPDDPQPVRLWDLSADTLLDQSTPSGGETVELHFPPGVEEGLVTIDMDGKQGFRNGTPAWFLVPEQPGYESGVRGRLAGVRARPGDSLQLAVAPGGVIRGRVIGSAEISAGSVRVYLRSMFDRGGRSAPVRTRGQRLETPVRADGSFRLTGIDAGLWRLSFTSTGGLIHMIEDVEVQLGEVCSDPRVQLVDLGAETRTLRLEVRAADGASIEKPLAVLILAGRRNEYFGKDGLVRFSLSRAQEAKVDERSCLIVLAQGYEPQILDPPFGDELVVLDPGIRLRVSPNAAFATNQGNHRYKFRLRASERPKAFADLFSTQLPPEWASGEPVEIRLPCAGRFNLEVLTHVKTGGIAFRPSGSGWTFTGVTVDVDLGATELVVTVPENLERFK